MAIVGVQHRSVLATPFEYTYYRMAAGRCLLGVLGFKRCVTSPGGLQVVVVGKHRRSGSRLVKIRSSVTRLPPKPGKAFLGLLEISAQVSFKQNASQT